MEQRTRKRIQCVLPARIAVINGSRSFVQLAHTLDVSRQGAKLGGIRLLLNSGDIVEIQ